MHIVKLQTLLIGQASKVKKSKKMFESQHYYECINTNHETCQQPSWPTQPHSTVSESNNTRKLII